MNNLMHHKDHNTILKGFINSFIKEDFFIDMMNVSLYPSDFKTNSTDDVSSLEYLFKFFKDLSKLVNNLKINNAIVIQNNIKLIETVLNIKQHENFVITYNNALKYISNVDLSGQKIIQAAIENQIYEDTLFRKKCDEILNSITIYYEVLTISTGLSSFENFIDYATDNKSTILEVTKLYKDQVIGLYNNLSKLQTVNKSVTEADYFLIENKNSTKDLAKSLIGYINNNYSFYKTGYNIIDRYIEGFESSSVHLISAPSNHGKSLLLVNLCKNIIDYNLEDFEENDVILYFTLEDDINKLVRRFCSIFGNFSQNLMKVIYRKFYEINKANKGYSNNKHIYNKQLELLETILNFSLESVTKSKVSLLLKHCSENSFCAGDLSKLIDRLTIEGKKVKLVFLDYLDVMTPTINKYTAAKDYDTQGQITQELRNCGRNHQIPIIVPTQNNKSSESETIPLSNNLIGDSYKKVRYSDFIYMFRQREGLSIFSDEVKKFVFNEYDYTSNLQNEFEPNILKYKNEIDLNLIPIEIKITKSKDEGRNAFCYILLCKQNLRMYNNVREYLTDLPIIIKNQMFLESKIELLTTMIDSSIDELPLLDYNPIDSNVCKIQEADLFLL